jgi:hypothetical protein
MTSCYLCRKSVEDKTAIVFLREGLGDLKEYRFCNKHTYWLKHILAAKMYEEME